MAESFDILARIEARCVDLASEKLRVIQAETLKTGAAARTASEEQVASERRVVVANDEQVASERRVTRAMEERAAVANRLALGIGVAFAAAGVAVAAYASKSAADLEKARAIVQGYTGATQSQMDAYSKGVAQISTETAKSQTELTQGLYYVISAGFKGADALKVLDASTKDAAASGTKMEVVSNILTGALRAYGASANDAQKYTDILSRTVVLGKVKLEDLATSMGRPLSVAAELGVSLAEVGAAMALLTVHQESARFAGMHLQQMFLAMYAPTAGMRKEADALGVAWQDLYNVKGNGLLNTLKEIETLARKNIPTTDTLAQRTALYHEHLKSLLGTGQAVAQFTILSSHGFKDLASNIDGTSNSAGTAQHAFDLWEKTTRAGLEHLHTNVQNIAIAFGQDLLPVINKVVNALNGFTSGIVKDIPTIHHHFDVFGKDFTKQMKENQSSWDDLGAAIHDGIGMIGNVLTSGMSILDQFRDHTKGTGDQTAQFVTDLVTGLKWLSVVVGEVFLAASGAVSGFLTIFIDVTKQTVNLVHNMLTLVHDLMTGNWGQIWTDAGRIVGGFVHDTVAIFVDMVNTLLDTLTKMYNKMAGLAHLPKIDWHIDVPGFIAPPGAGSSDNVFKQGPVAPGGGSHPLGGAGPGSSPYGPSPAAAAVVKKSANDILVNIESVIAARKRGVSAEIAWAEAVIDQSTKATQFFVYNGHRILVNLDDIKFALLLGPAAFKTYMDGQIAMWDGSAAAAKKALAESTKDHKEWLAWHKKVLAEATADHKEWLAWHKKVLAEAVADLKAYQAQVDRVNNLQAKWDSTGSKFIASSVASGNAQIANAGSVDTTTQGRQWADYEAFKRASAAYAAGILSHAKNLGVLRQTELDAAAAVRADTAANVAHTKKLEAQTLSDAASGITPAMRAAANEFDHGLKSSGAVLAGAQNAYRIYLETGVGDGKKLWESLLGVTASAKKFSDALAVAAWILANPKGILAPVTGEGGQGGTDQTAAKFAVTISAVDATLLAMGGHLGDANGRLVPFAQSVWNAHLATIGFTQSMISSAQTLAAIIANVASGIGSGGHATEGGTRTVGGFGSQILQAQAGVNTAQNAVAAAQQAVITANTNVIVAQQAIQTGLLTNQLTAIQDQSAILTAQAGVQAARMSGVISAVTDQSAILNAQAAIAQATSPAALKVAQDQLKIAVDTMNMDQRNAAYAVVIARDQVRIALDQTAIDQTAASMAQVILKDQFRIAVDQAKIALDGLRLAEAQLKIATDNLSVLERMANFFDGGTTDQASKDQALLAGLTAQITSDQGQLSKDQNQLASDQAAAAQLAAQGALQIAGDQAKLAADQAAANAASQQGQLRIAEDNLQLTKDQIIAQAQQSAATIAAIQAASQAQIANQQVEIDSLKSLLLKADQGIALNQSAAAGGGTVGAWNSFGSTLPANRG